MLGILRLPRSAATCNLFMRKRWFSTVRSPLKSFKDIPGPEVVPEQGGTIYDFVGKCEKFGNVFTATDLYREEYGDLVKHDFGGREEVWVYHPSDA